MAFPSNLTDAANAAFAHYAYKVQESASDWKRFDEFDLEEEDVATQMLWHSVTLAVLTTAVPRVTNATLWEQGNIVAPAGYKAYMIATGQENYPAYDELNFNGRNDWQVVCRAIVQHYFEHKD